MTNGNGSPTKHDQMIAALMLEHAAIVRLVAMKILHDWTLAEDIVQETFLRVFQSFNKFEGESDVRTWIITIARNRAIDRLRRLRIEASCELDDSHKETLHIKTDHFCRKWFSGVSIKNLREILSDSDLRLIYLKDVEGLSIDELALKYKKTNAAIRIDVHRAKKRARKLLQEKGIHP